MCDWDEEADQTCFQQFNNLNLKSNANSSEPSFNQDFSSDQWKNSSSFGQNSDSDGRGRGRVRGRGGGRGTGFKNDNFSSGSFGNSGESSNFWNNDSNGGNSGFDSKSSGGCHNCGETGHMKRECLNPRKQFGSSGGGSSRACHKCGEEGHMIRDCPKSTNGFSKGCHNCGEEGHIRRDCPNPSKAPSGGADGMNDGKPGPQTYVPVELDDSALFDQGVSAGSNFSAFDSVSVKVSGDGEIPGKIEHFSESNLRSLLLENVQKAGYSRPLPVQKHAIPIIMGGRDLMACAQTGSGKTAAFLLPILNYIMENNLDAHAYGDKVKPTALILSPTRELAIQISNEGRKFAVQSIVKVCVVYGGTSVSHQERTLQRGCHVLVATPGRLVDFLEKGLISFECVKYFVLDEADRMLDMGFKPAIEKVVFHSSFPDQRDRRTLMFSATFPEDIQQLSKRYLTDYVFIVTGMIGAANVDVCQMILNVPSSDKRQKLLEFIREQLELKSNEKILVFVETKRMADFIALFLTNNQINTTSIHGDRFQSQREEALREFKSGVRNVLVATAVAARGLDIKGVGIVLNYDMPKEIDEYVHRIGRTGRVGNPGRAVSFFDETNDAGMAKNLVKLLSDAEQEVPEWLIQCAHYSGGVMSFQGINKFGASDIRNQVNKEEFASAPSYASGPISVAPQSCIPDDEESWD